MTATLGIPDRKQDVPPPVFLPTDLRDRFLTIDDKPGDRLSWRHHRIFVVVHPNSHYARAPRDTHLPARSQGSKNPSVGGMLLYLISLKNEACHDTCDPLPFG